MKRITKGDTIELIQLEITLQDIELAGSLAQSALVQKGKRALSGPSPASVALERVTGSKWKTLGAVVVMEDRAPFRFGSVPFEGIAPLKHFLTTSQMQPCFLQLELRVFGLRLGDES